MLQYLKKKDIIFKSLIAYKYIVDWTNNTFYMNHYENL